MPNVEKDSGTILGYILESIIPYTDANLNLVFRPSNFFRELERRDKASPVTLRSTYYRAKAKGLIVYADGIVSLSAKAQQKIASASAPSLPTSQSLMVAFDIPEDMSHKRRQLRSLLKELKFTQAQRSVWVSSVDHREMVLSLISELGLSPYAKVFLSTSLN